MSRGKIPQHIPRGIGVISLNISNAIFGTQISLYKKLTAKHRRETITEILSAEILGRHLIGFADFWGSAVAFAARLWEVWQDPTPERPRLAYRRAPGSNPCVPTRSIGLRAVLWHGCFEIRNYSTYLRKQIKYVCLHNTLLLLQCRPPFSKVVILVICFLRYVC